MVIGTFNDGIVPPKVPASVADVTDTLPVLLAPLESVTVTTAWERGGIGVLIRHRLVLIRAGDAASEVPAVTERVAVGIGGGGGEIVNGESRDPVVPQALLRRSVAGWLRLSARICAVQRRKKQ